MRNGNNGEVERAAGKRLTREPLRIGEGRVRVPERPGLGIDLDVIRWFGERKKIFLVHFRNVRGGRDNLVLEIFPDEGAVDMVKALKVYREVGYDGMLVPDHVPFGP